MHTQTANLIRYQREPLASVWADIQPLLVVHWRELSNFLDIPLAIDESVYRQSEAAGKLVLVTARTDANHLIGYVAFVVATNPHYRSSLQAVQDVFYVDPNHRNGGVGFQLISTSESLLRELGVQVVYHHVKLAHPALGHLLSHYGYQRVETIFAKRLDEEPA